MNLDQVFEWILRKPLNYPGKHQNSQPRTNNLYKPIESKAQFHIILKATAEFVKERMLEAKSINLRKFGAFTFEVISDTVKPAQLSNFDLSKDFDLQKSIRKHIHKIRPCFIPDRQLKYALQKYQGKEEISVSSSQHSIYQQGFQMMVCNAGPISSACFLGKDVVDSAQQAFIQAIYDLTTLGQSLNLDFGFVVIQIHDRNLKYIFEKQFVQQLNNVNFEQKMRKADPPTNVIWNTTYQDKWAKSSLVSLLKKPIQQKVEEFYEKTLALKIMSLDMNTTEKILTQKVKSYLPVIKQNQDISKSTKNLNEKK